MAKKRDFDGVKTYQDFDCCNFNSKEVIVDKPIYLGFTFLKFSKLFTYEPYYNFLQPFFDPNLERNLHLHYMDCDSSFLSLKTGNSKW